MSDGLYAWVSVEEARAWYGTDCDAAHDFDHALRVLRVAERIARAEGADLRIVRTAALLHDVGRAQADPVGQDHAAVGAALARAILAERCPPHVIEVITHAIATHRFRSEARPETLEAQVLFDADKLDAIGAVGVARAFAYGGMHGQRLWVPLEAVDVSRWQREGGDPAKHTPVHEFVVKLQWLCDALYTPTGRRLAEERHAFMVAFFRRFDAEVRGEC